MSYRTVDEFKGFNFKDAHITSMERANGHFIAILDDVKILPDNSCNRDIREMRTNELELKLQDGVITEFILEGCKIYNADGILMEQKEDEAVPPSKYDEILKNMEDSYIYDIVKSSMPDLLNPTLTASWEKGLTMVADTEIKPEEFMKKLSKYICDKVYKFRDMGY